MLVKPTDALIHFDYIRYFHYYRIREVREALILFSLLKVDGEKRLEDFMHSCDEKIGDIDCDFA